MALFVLRYVSNLLIFALGLRAPGIAGNLDPDYHMLDDDSTMQSRYYQRVRLQYSIPVAYNICAFEKISTQRYLQRLDDNTSTWTNLWYKIKVLAPFLWPRSSFLLQLRVLFCFVLLICGRLINLYVPIYNKKIVDSVSITPVVFRYVKI